MAEFAVVLVEPKYEGNVGSIARVMKNFGFTKLVLVNPPTMGSEARRNSMHALDILLSAESFKSLSEVKKKFDFLVATSAIVAGDRNALRIPVTPEALENAVGAEGSVGIVFGREDYGLHNEEILLCDMIVNIPSNPEYPTLNVAQSVGVILYELSRQRMREKLKGKKFDEFSAKEKEVLLDRFDKLVDGLYDMDFDRKIVKKTFRQLIGRAFVSGREATTLIGLFKRAWERAGVKAKK